MSCSWTAFAAAASCGDAKHNLDDEFDEEDEEDEKDEDGEVLSKLGTLVEGGGGGGFEFTIDAIVAAVAAALD